LVVEGVVVVADAGGDGADEAFTSSIDVPRDPRMGTVPPRGNKALMASWGRRCRRRRSQTLRVRGVKPPTVVRRKGKDGVVVVALAAVGDDLLTDGICIIGVWQQDSGKGPRLGDGAAAYCVPHLTPHALSP